MGIAKKSVNISVRGIFKRMQIKQLFRTPVLTKLPRSVKTMLMVALAYFASAFIKIYPAKENVGFFSGECTGTCNLNYEITSGKLVIDWYSNKTNMHQHKVIDGTFSYLKVGVPLLLVLHPYNFGCPDCSDGGALTFRFKLFGIQFNYALDKGHETWYFKNMGQAVSNRISRIDAILPYEE